MRQFLPPPVEGKDYNLPQARSTHWINAGFAVLNQIPDVMAQPAALTEARRPTPFSRAFQFHGSLRGDSGFEVQEKARLAFRGISALLALREMILVDLRVALTPALNDPAVSGSNFAQMLGQHVPALPQNFAPGQQFPYIGLHAGDQSAVVAGLSPLTCFFPAARRLPQRLASPIFWYDPLEGLWSDPTANPSGGGYHGPDRTRTDRARSLMKLWLEAALREITQGAALAVGMHANDRQMIVQEWRAWLSELDGVSSTGSIVRKSLTPPEIAAGAMPFYLELVPEPDGGEIVSSFPSRNGVYLVTRRMLEDRNVQISGNIYGSPDLAMGWKDAPTRGANLGTALGKPPWYAALPYVFLDKLFTPKLSTITDQVVSGEVRREWIVLRERADVGAAQSAGRRLWLFPFDPQILEFFTAAELRDSTEMIRGEARCTVRLKIPGQEAHERWEVTRHYHQGAQEITELDPGFDFRIFPNLDLRSIPDLEVRLPRAEDRRQFARLRLSPESENLEWLPLVRDEYPSSPYLERGAFSLRPLGDFDLPAGRNHLAKGKAWFWEFPDVQRAFGGMSIRALGFFLMRPPTSTLAGQPAPWEIGIDFGTSNSCVAYKHGAQPQPLDFPSLTTSLQPLTSIIRLGDSHEGASFQLDFPYSTLAGRPLTGGEYFPTQIVTKLSPKEPRSPDDSGAPLDARKFDLRNGLVFFRNLAQVTLEEPMVGCVMHDFPSGLTSQDDNVAPRFYLCDQIKWQEEHPEAHANRTWRTVFHRHLRLQLLLTAISQQARIVRVVFSYPRAFNADERELYFSDIRRIWSEADPGAVAPVIEIRFMTESEAAAHRIQVGHGVDETVLDIGGGTTDIAVFSDQTLDGETSFRIAAGVLDSYVLQSPGFRQAFCTAYARLAPEQTSTSRRLQASFGDARELKDEARRCIWFGLLNTLLAADHSGGAVRQLGTELRQNAARPVQGFFMSTALMFGGLAFFAGLMDRERHRLRQGTGRGQNSRSITLIGNGSRYVHLLEFSEDPAWRAFLQELFEIGAALERRQVPCRPLEKNPKAAIAMGLIESRFPRATGQRTVYSSIDSDGFTVSGARADSLTAFYRAILQPDSDVRWIHADHSNFHKFLEALDLAIPGGKLAGVTVIPGIASTPAWASELARSENGLLTGKIRQRLLENAAHYRNDLEQNIEGVSLEPLFITELAGLLACVSAKYGAV